MLVRAQHLRHDRRNRSEEPDPTLGSDKPAKRERNMAATARCASMRPLDSFWHVVCSRQRGLQWLENAKTVTPPVKAPGEVMFVIIGQKAHQHTNKKIGLFAKRNRGTLDLHTSTPASATHAAHEAKKCVGYKYA